jgi:hypothetical protein
MPQQPHTQNAQPSHDLSLSLSPPIHRSSTEQIKKEKKDGSYTYTDQHKEK